MREIKFKGLNTKNQWIYGSLVITTSWLKSKPKQHTKTWIIESSFGNGGWFNIRKRQYVLPKTVCQFTGLNDKNGKPIYEGDIVFQDLGHEKINNTFNVIFQDGIFVTDKIVYLGNNISAKMSIGSFNRNLEFEVIGNIHNKENNANI